jgi:hypothetical protein
MKWTVSKTTDVGLLDFSALQINAWGKVTYYEEVFYKLLLNLEKSCKTFQNTRIALFD